MVTAAAPATMTPCSPWGVGLVHKYVPRNLVSAAFLDAPGGADLVRGVLARESGHEPGTLLEGQVLVPGEEQVSVDPHPLLGCAAPPVAFTADPLPDLGDHCVGQGHQVPLVDRDLCVEQGDPE